MAQDYLKQPYVGALTAAAAQESRTRELAVVNSIDEVLWKEYVAEHPLGNIFHTPEMFEVFRRTRGVSPTLWAAVSGTGQIEALLLPVQVTLSKRLKALTTRAISYGSLMCSPTEEGRHALSALLGTYVRESRGQCLFTELRNVSDLGDVQPLLQAQGFRYEEHLNYLIDLKGRPEDVFMNIGPRTRKNLKKALNKAEVSVREVTKPEEIEACYGLLSRTYQAARVPLADRSLFDAAFDILVPRGMIRFTLAYVGTEPVAVSVDLLYKDVIYGWYGGTDRAYSRYIPNDVLMWEVLKWASEKGYSYYDFGGAGRPEEEYGVRDYKAKFGGKMVSYGRNTYVHRPGLLWLSKQGYRIVRRLFNGRF